MAVRVTYLLPVALQQIFLGNSHNCFQMLRLGMKARLLLLE
jgi:hypothetical protein